jgi:hypothetical protein
MHSEHDSKVDSTSMGVGPHSNNEVVVSLTK